MSLNTLLTAMKNDFVANANSDILAIMGSARQQLEDSGLHKQALGAGEKLPDFVLKDTNGKDFSSRDALDKGPLLISWYRGIW